MFSRFFARSLSQLSCNGSMVYCIYFFLEQISYFNKDGSEKKLERFSGDLSAASAQRLEHTVDAEPSKASKGFKSFLLLSAPYPPPPLSFLLTSDLRLVSVRFSNFGTSSFHDF